MRVEIAEDAGGRGPAMAFPPGQNYVDLRENPHAVERIDSARQHAPFRNFLLAVNGAESLFLSAGAGIRADSPAAVSGGEAFEFGSEVSLVFSESSFNFDRGHYRELAARLKELAERDTGDAVRLVLRISPCDFTARSRRGFCLGVRLVAHGATAQQAEMRWGLGLARLQQALLFSARALRQQLGA